MILKKPYAFLIKHFKKIHWLLVAMCAFLFYKTTTVSGFLQSYMDLGSYDPLTEPISKYLSPLFYIILLLTLIIFVIIIALLRYKKKPFKIYLIYCIEYLGLFILALVLNHYFTYLDTLTTAAGLALKDVLVILKLPQYVILLLLVIRAIGLDLSKFGFEEEAFLTAEETDNEEFEFRYEVDQDKFRRRAKKQIRYLKYFYMEHAFPITIIAGMIFTILLGFTLYDNFVINRVYKEGSSIQANSYQIKINKSYLTDKDKAGNYITGKDSKKQFLVVDTTVKNVTGSSVMLNTERFRIINRTNSYTPTLRYNDAFKDLGNGYEKKELAPGETRNILLIYEVDRSLEEDRFILYYQQVLGANELKARKFKLKVENVSQIETVGEFKWGEGFTLPFRPTEVHHITFEQAGWKDVTNYYHESCTADGCKMNKSLLYPRSGKTILELSFLSEGLDGVSFIDFSSQYGKIKYSIDDVTKVINISDAVGQKYQGNILYISCPVELKNATKLELEYTIRNKKYIYHIK